MANSLILSAECWWCKELRSCDRKLCLSYTCATRAERTWSGSGRAHLVAQKGFGWETRGSQSEIRVGPRDGRVGGRARCCGRCWCSCRCSCRPTLPPCSARRHGAPRGLGGPHRLAVPRLAARRSAAAVPPRRHCTRPPPPLLPCPRRCRRDQHERRVSPADAATRRPARRNDPWRHATQDKGGGSKRRAAALRKVDAYNRAIAQRRKRRRRQ